MSLFKKRRASDAHTLTEYPMPDLETLEQTRGFFEETADGDYDGWEASV